MHVSKRKILSLKWTNLKTIILPITIWHLNLIQQIQQTQIFKKMIEFILHKRYHVSKF
jgi:hypothetical protein